MIPSTPGGMYDLISYTNIGCKTALLTAPERSSIGGEHRFAPLTTFGGKMDPMLSSMDSSDYY